MNDYFSYSVNLDFSESSLILVNFITLRPWQGSSLFLHSEDGLQCNMSFDGSNQCPFKVF